MKQIYCLYQIFPEQMEPINRSVCENCNPEVREDCSGYEEISSSEIFNLIGQSADRFMERYLGRGVEE